MATEETIDDFAVRLTDSNHVEFASPTRGRLAWFPAWEHADRDLRHFIAADVPIGTRDLPYEDRDEEEEWSIRIFEDGGWVHVEGGDSSFRVRRERYLQAWAALIDFYNPIVPLDEPGDES